MVSQGLGLTLKNHLLWNHCKEFPFLVFKLDTHTDTKRAHILRLDVVKSIKIINNNIKLPVDVTD